MQPQRKRTMHADAYLRFIVERVAAGDRLAPFDQLIATWWVNWKEGRAAKGTPPTVPLPARIRAGDLLSARIDLYSAAALHLCARCPGEMLETDWAVPLRSVTAALFNAEDIGRAEARQILGRLVKRVALTACEAQDLKQLHCLVTFDEIPVSATALLDDLRVPLFENRHSGWAAYENGRVPTGDMGAQLQW